MMPRFCATILSFVATSVILPVVLTQSVTPDALTLGDLSPVCSLGTVKEEICIQLPPDSTSTLVDVFFLFDDTGSFADLVTDVQRIFSSLVAELVLAAPSVDFAFGVGRFEDYGGPGTGFSLDYKSARPFILNQPIVTTADAGGSEALKSLIGSALLRTAPGYGGDTPESAVAEGLFQAATGLGFDGDGDGKTTGIDGTQTAGALSTQISGDDSGDVPAFSTLDPSILSSGSVGGAGFRETALKLIILATDTCSIVALDSSKEVPESISGTFSDEAITEYTCGHAIGTDRNGFVSDSYVKWNSTVENAVVPKGAGTVSQTVAALNEAGIRVLGLEPKNTTLSFLHALARTTGATDAKGDALVFEISGGTESIKNAIVDAVSTTVVQPINLGIMEECGVDGVAIVSPDKSIKSAPGETACFDVELTGLIEGVSGTCNILVVDDDTGLVLGTTQVTFECLAEGTAPCENAITGFTLINAAIDSDIGPLPSVLDLNELPTKFLNIRAEFESCPDNPIDSVLVEFEQHVFCELYTPYSVFQDRNPGGPDIADDAANYLPFKFSVGGPYHVKATPFTGPNCDGDMGFPKEAELKVVDCNNKIVAFTLIDAETNTDIGTLTSEIDLAKLPTKKLNIRAEYESCAVDPIDSVLVQFQSKTNCEMFTPYAVFGDKNPDGPDLTNDKARYQHFSFPIGGPYSIAATPFSGGECDGQKGVPLEMKIQVVDSSCPSSVASFYLFDAESDLRIQELTDGDVICTSLSPINIEAAVAACASGSVQSIKFELGGAERQIMQENYAPYYLFGNKGGDVLGQYLVAGNYTLRATPYSHYNLHGSAGAPHLISFQVSSKCDRRLLRVAK